MLNQKISSKLKNFIFLFVDSVELIDVLLFLYKFPEKWFNPDEISLELKSTPRSISNRLSKLVDIGLLKQNSLLNVYTFHPVNDELKTIVHELFKTYSTHRHRIIESIYSLSK